MKAKLIVASLALVSFTAPSFAQSSFYIVRGSDGKCTVVDKKPVDTKVVVVGGDGKVYTTRAEAEKEVTVVCK